jgi:hypothetical protein
MRKKWIDAEAFRVSDGTMATQRGDRFGAFYVPHGGEILKVIAHDGSGWRESGLPGRPWEHVSVSLPNRTPTWEEMDFVKRLFWEDSETVVQYHVPLAEHVNYVATCLHLWRMVGGEYPKPPGICVGPATKAQAADIIGRLRSTKVGQPVVLED